MFVSARRIYLRLQKDEIPTRFQDIRRKIFFFILLEMGGALTSLF
jgi:hypothetical protein